MARIAEMYGYFVPPTTWCLMVTERLLSNPSQGELMILAKILDGSDPELLKYVLEDLAITLQDDSICLSLCVSLIIIQDSTILKYSIIHCIVRYSNGKICPMNK
jgi:hypothetical protein